VSAGFGQDEVFEPQHVFVLRSQHCTPPASAGQLLAQSLSVAHDGAHFFSAGAAGADAGGSFVVSAGGGSVGAATVSSGTSELSAQAAAASAIITAVTASADFDKVAYFTGRTLRQAPPEIRPDRLTAPFPDDRSDHSPSGGALK
jgi:hypothetical protein